MMTLLSVFCCCGIPGYFAKPMWEQYPANAALPAQLADLKLRQDAASTQTAAQLEQDVNSAHWLADDTFAGIYTDPNGKRVTVFGVTGFRLTPERDAESEISRLTEKYGLTGVQTMETDIRGEHRRCGTGRDGQTDVVVCVWADHGSLGSGVFTWLSIADSNALLSTLRANIVTRG